MIDMHVHSTISDGMETPSETIKKAAKLGLTAVAITDHDCIDGLEEAQEESKRHDIIFVPGIELSVSYGENRLIHILGLNIDWKNEAFLQLYKAYRQSRNKQIDHIIKGIRKRFNIDIPLDELYDLSTDGMLDRQTVAKWLLFKGYTSMMKYSWINYIDHFDYVSGELLDMKTALEMIRLAGGKSFMAHFHKPIGLKGYNNRELNTILQHLKSLGLDGMEAFYPDFTKEDYLKVQAILDNYDFLSCGGSDYHGSNRPSVSLGIGEGTMVVPDGLLRDILEDDVMLV